MSHRGRAGPPSNSAFTSKTVFDSLDVESGEEEEEEEVIPPKANDDAAPVSQTPAQPKLSKGAQKRAAKAARLAQLQPIEGTQVNPVQVLAESETDPAPPTANGVAPNPNGAAYRASKQDTAEEQLNKLKGVAASPRLAQRLRSRSPKERQFDPVLPPLPHVVSPLVRKRKASHDLPSNPLAKESKIEVEIRDIHGEVVGGVDVPVTVSSSLTVPDEREKRRRNAGIRTLWTLIMFGGFILLLLMGHVYMILLVFLCQSLVYREVTALFALGGADKSDEVDREGGDPWSKTLNWYFFAITNYFLYGETIIYYFKHVVFSDANFLPFAMNHRFISFMLWTMGFMGFVTSLKKQYLRKQFGLFCWVHMSLLVIVVSSHFIVNNILEGMIWFWVPASLVICNDIFAYIWGVTTGRTPLFKLSPKKTVEGFIGAFFSTLILGVLYGTFFMQFDYMICPAQNLGISAWSSVSCTPNPVFVWREWAMWPPLRVLVSSVLGRPVSHIPYAPYQFHVLIMACFASLVAPFGGFFASAFKRAFDIKDFGDSIPGHGGITDRMDCQFLMGMFSYVYYSSLIRVLHVTVGSVLQTIVSGLSAQEQVELFHDLRRYLETSGGLHAS